MEHRLPIVTRWTLYALGAVEGQRVRRPRDPVAAWLLRRHPKLLPTFAAPSILSMIRARSAIVDRMLEDEVHAARRGGTRLAVYTFGAGFDARWYRLRPVLQDVPVTHVEVEDPEVLRFKDQALSTSSFAGLWESVRQVPSNEDRWTVAEASDGPTLVVLEGVASRVGLEGLKGVLTRLRHDVPHAHVIVDLPGILHSTTTAQAVAVGVARSRWMSAVGTGASALHERDLERIGWLPHDDVWLSARPELRAPSGVAMCAGMEALRVLLLRPAL
jgi:O-methyltransferase involved in polyketide biosynthesis